MRSTSQPIVIVGGGCAGLSLATHLCDTGLSRNIVVIERRTFDEYTNDRTWCGFGTRPHRFDYLTQTSWKRWAFAGNESVAILEGQSARYTRIRSGDFYSACLSQLKQDPRVTLLMGNILTGFHPNAVEVRERNGGRRSVIDASHIFDSRPPDASTLRGGPTDVLLWQQFVGLEVEVDEDSFDPETMTMMDFRTPQHGGIHFVYVLPTGRRTAMVELTGFVRGVRSFESFTGEITGYLKQYYGAVSLKVCRREEGVIPMTTAPFGQSPSLSVTRIGLAGGAAKPSTGYAFAAIQEHSRLIAASLLAGKPDAPLPGRWISLALDRIFLSYLVRNPAKAPELFLRIATGTDPDRFARFMMNHGTLIDDMAVIASMPKLPFVIEAIRSCPLWIRQPSRQIIPTETYGLSSV